MTTNAPRGLECPNCGALLHLGNLACDYCGATIVATRAAEVVVPAVAAAQNLIPQMCARIEANAYDGDAYYQLGLACFTLRLYDQAENAFEQAKRLLPGVAVAHYFAGLAMLYNSQGEVLSAPSFRLRQMQEEFDTALALDPNLVEAQPYRDFVYGMMARNNEDYAGAIDPLTATVHALPDFVLAWHALAACYFQIGQHQNAIEAARQALQRQPNDESSVFLIGSAYAFLKDTAEMEAWVRRLAEIRGEPNNWQRALRELRGQFD